MRYPSVGNVRPGKYKSLFDFLFGASLFWLVVIGAIAALPLKAYFKDEYEGIAQQLYEPPAE